MAKYFNNQKKTGKMAGSVFAIRFGETIERAYNPSVHNPKSTAQIESRAKLKLLSQAAAVLAPVIAMRREGAVSARNLFVSRNYPLVAFAEGKATMPVQGIQLTKSVVAIPAVSATRGEAGYNVTLSGGDVNLSRVVYVLLQKTANDELRLIDSLMVSTPGVDNRFSTAYTTNQTVNYVLAYGVRDNTDAARVYFENLEVTDGNLAQILTSRVLTDADITLTETAGFIVQQA